MSLKKMTRLTMRMVVGYETSEVKPFVQVRLDLVANDEGSVAPELKLRPGKKGWSRSRRV